MNSLITQSDFDYSLVADDTASKLKGLSNQLDGIYQNYSIAVGEVLYQAQQELAGYGNGVFGQWVESKGISKSNSYNYINAYKFVQQLDEPQDKEIFLSQPQRLKNEMSKPSANKEVNQAVFNGDVTTHKEYKELERQLNQAKADLEEKNAQNERLAEMALSKEEPQVIEKEVIKEVIPDDYESTKQLNQTLLGKNKELSKMVDDALQHEEYLKSQLKEFYAKRDEVNHKSAKYDELTEAIKQSEGKLNSYQKKIASYKNITELLKKGDLLLLEMSGLIYADETHYIQRDGLIKQEFDSLVDRGLKLFNDLDMKRKNTEILEGEVL